eukprot:5208871-Prymnesium_polylepis.1
MLGAIAQTFILGYYELVMEMVNSVIGRCSGMEVGTNTTAEHVVTQPFADTVLESGPAVADSAAVSVVGSSGTIDALSKYMPHS